MGFNSGFEGLKQLIGSSAIRADVLYGTLANDQLDAQIFIPLLQSSTCTCFEQYLAHPQEVKLY